jgi:hypothetical protein
VPLLTGIVLALNGRSDSLPDGVRVRRGARPPHAHGRLLVAGGARPRLAQADQRHARPRGGRRGRSCAWARNCAEADSVSWGVAELDASSGDFDRLFDAADVELYAAERAARAG